VLPNTTPDQTYVATSRAATIYGSRVGMRPGKAYTLDDLWYAAFLPSANDAAIGLAEANGGVAHTVQQMNEIASRLQAGDTVARTPNGLDTPGQVSSVYDLSLIARAGMARPDFAKYAGAARATFPNMVGRGSHPIYTTNRLLLHGYRGMIGVKTGFTSRAGRTYVGAARRHGTTLLVAFLGIHESSESAARKLLDWGFANRAKVTPIGTLVDPLPDAPAGQGAAGSSTPAVAGTSRSDAASALTAPAPTGMTSAVLWGAGIVALGGAAAWGLSRLGRRRSPAA
jgi:D-alanyl-D-alanine carboxypeptidase (penicillin-binding protein 5/6)